MKEENERMIKLSGLEKDIIKTVPLFEGINRKILSEILGFGTDGLSQIFLAFKLYSMEKWGVLKSEKVPGKILAEAYNYKLTKYGEFLHSKLI